MQNKLTLKNYHVNIFGKWLNALVLAGKDSHYRTSFVKMLVGASETIEEMRKTILEKYVEKDKDGNMKEVTTMIGDKPLLDENGKEVKKYDMTPDNETLFTKDWSDYMSEDCIIDIPASKEKIVMGVRDVVFNTDQIIKDEYKKDKNGKVVEIIAWKALYDEWCNALDKAVE